MQNIKIKSAIIHYNENVREKDMPKMTQKSLGGLILSNNGSFYISNWCNGKHLGKLKPEHIHSICEACSVDANFLYGIESMNLKK